ncbi:hypothetical protein K469DRAFT_683246 [Zopfia rhizophila CBS 207.26]|uniref:Uncharacterized protein n=1 Tax=Zopfia rhizophila CBS 207.26 TaxID=1314779 RepID=A0A6A6EH31_9PEZI|nr:hypothetical protein K469DRAFT_683246 [Zopfia rhizophila CBS 207.26]
MSSTASSNYDYVNGMRTTQDLAPTDVPTYFRQVQAQCSLHLSALLVGSQMLVAIVLHGAEDVPRRISLASLSMPYWHGNLATSETRGDLNVDAPERIIKGLRNWEHAHMNTVSSYSFS